MFVEQIGMCRKKSFRAIPLLETNIIFQTILSKGQVF